MSTRTLSPARTTVPARAHRRRERLAELRTRPERGSHATEYAIGIGLAAAVILALFAAYRLGIDGIVARWFFG